MKIKIVQNIGENIQAFEEVNKYPLLGSLFTELKKLCSFDWLTPNEKIVEILQELYFERIKKTLTYKQVFLDGVEEILVYQGSNLISERHHDYGTAEELKTMEDVDKHIRNWFIKGLKIEFPVKNLN